MPITDGYPSVLVVATLILLSGALVEPRIGNAASCGKGTADRAATGSGFIDRARGQWGYEFRVESATCGKLTGDAVLDMVVVLSVEGGTGSSPRPFAIFNGNTRREFQLRHVDLNLKRLICARSVRIRDRVLTILRPSQYLGAYTVCDRINQFRWTAGRYRSQDASAFRSCDGTQIARLRAAGISCRRAAEIAYGHAYRQSTARGWQCSPTDPNTRDVTCQSQSNFRQWLKFSTRLD